MMKRDYQIRMIARETLRYEDSKLDCEMQCCYDPAAHAYSVVFPSNGHSHGQLHPFTQEESQLVRDRIKGYLGTRRLFGIPLRNCEVNFL